MNIRSLLIVGVLAVILQYLWISEHQNAFLVPELGVLLLAMSITRLAESHILLGGLALGYVADILGAVEQGSLLAGYVIAALILIGSVRLIVEPTRLQQCGIILLAVGVFHAVVAVIASPVIIVSWLSVVAAQLVSALLIALVHFWMQKRWDPAR